MHGQKGLNRQILTIAYPAIATNIATPLLSLVDVAVVGHIGNAVYIGAITVGGAAFNMLYWVFGFLRASTSGFTAQAYGAQDMAGCVRTLMRSSLLAVVIGILLIALSRGPGQLLLRFMDDGDTTQSFATLYFGIAIWGSPGVMLTYTLSGWFLGMQDSRPAMWTAIVANSLNILLNLTFVFAFHWGLAGVAAATAVSQWAGAITAICFLRKKLPEVPWRSWSKGFWNMRDWLRLLSVNTDLMLRTLCLIAVTMWFTRAGAKSGVAVLAANALIMQLFMLFSYFMDGFAYSGEALAGKFAGARDTEGIRRVSARLIKWGTGLSVIVSLLYFFFEKWFISLLTSDAMVVETVEQYRYWAVIVPVAGFLSFLWDGIYIGISRTGLMLITMLMAMVVFFATYFGLHTHWGNHALWLAFILYLITRGGMQTILFPHALRLTAIHHQSNPL